MFRKTIATLSAILFVSTAFAGVIEGLVTDAQTEEPLIGVTILVEGNSTGTSTDIDGRYQLKLKDGNYEIIAKYIGYMDAKVNVTLKGDKAEANFRLSPDNSELDEVTVTARVRQDTELTQIKEQQTSLVVQTGVSAQMIAKTQDKDASEVIRRIPGISIIDDKFVMVRGLSQRYNNVWLNGSAVPSSEADSRAFSFDILPSSQLENMVIIKSPAPEYPADFTGGFVLVNTKQQPVNSSLNISVSLGYNTKTHLKEFLKSKGSPTDWLGFDNGFRGLNAGMKYPLITFPNEPNKIDPLANSFNNDWSLRTIHPFADLKLSASYNKTWILDESGNLGLVAALNYGNNYKTLTDMENSLYGPYDTSNNKEVILRKATDNQYSNDVRLGALFNLTFVQAGGNNIFEWKNIFNQLGKDRYSIREGINAQPDKIEDYEYYYSSRTTYNTQFTGKHTIEKNFLDWSVGYAYSNRNMPDRRRIERTDRTDQRMSIYRISREFSKLDEHIASAGINYKGDFTFSEFTPTLKAGAYGEYRTRTYNTREFQYGWDPDNSLPSGFVFDENIPESVLVNNNYGPDKLYMYEEVNYLNDYNGKQSLIAGYAGLNIPWRMLSLYAGVRYEYCRQTLGLNTKQYEESMKYTNYDYNDFFPSVNMMWKINSCNQLRLAYGRSVNRPEFRELAPSVYYDFDLGSNVMGNFDLKAAYIDNYDFRYEFYPSKGEQISFALFYKRFKNPIEWTYTVAGGTDLIYSFINALGADNYGAEVDIKKNLDFIGLKDFSLSFNGSIIKSDVRFAPGSNEIDRSMQGQSPYLINGGLFYNNKEYGWSAAILYNRIGKRIIGVGNRYGTASDGTAKNIPNSYEMPRDNIDLSLGKTFGRWEVKLSARDILAQKYLFKQFEKVTLNGKETTIEEVTRTYKPGVNFSLSAGYTF